LIASVVVNAERCGLRARADGGVDRDAGWGLKLLGLVEALKLVDVTPVVRRHHLGGLGGVVRGAAADGDERVALVLRVHLIRVHNLEVLGIGLDLVVDGDRDARVLEVGLALVDDACALESRGYKEHVPQAHRRRFRTGLLIRPRAEQ
jgi:hypothetical protein